jgi:amino acid adenylation domain-containing protein
LLDRLRAADIRLTLDDERVNVSAPQGALTAELRVELQRLKVEIKSHLRDMAEKRRSAAEGVQPVARNAHMPVSHNQQRLWFMKQMDPGNPAYNVPGAFMLRGLLDVAALERTLAELVARHESLRTRFVSIEGVPRCIVQPAAELPLKCIDLSSLPEAQREAQLMELLVQLARRPFDTGRCPLMHVLLVRLAPDLHVFSFVLDHIVADGVSTGVLVVELEALYAAHRAGQPIALPPLPVQYLDYADWQRRWFAGGVLDQQLDYWRRQLRAPLAVLQLPTDRPRPPVQTSNGARVTAQFSLALADEIRALGRREGTTLFMTLLAAFQALLHRYTGETDIAVGSAIANRNRSEVERVVGFFANNLVLRGDLSGNPTLRELLGRVRETSAHAYANQDAPFDLLVETLAPPRALDHSPLFQVMFVLHSARVTELRLPGLKSQLIEMEMGTARFDLAVDVFDVSDGLSVYFEYNTDLFSADTMSRMVGHYRTLLEGFAAHLDTRIGKLPMLTAAEREQLTRTWNATERPWPHTQVLHQLFEAQAARTPEAQAVRFEGTGLKYAALNARANRLARRLRTEGARPGSLVGLCIERGIDMVVALLAIQKSGAAYVPLDPGFPAERLAYMLSDSGATVLLTKGEADAGVALPDGVYRLDMASEVGALASLDTTDLPAAACPDDTAYVIYTSGSTGRPKGVAVAHGALVNFLVSMRESPGLSDKDVLAAVTTISFDIAGLELYLPWLVGARVELVSRGIAADGAALAAQLAACGATVLQATPATWRLLVEAGWQGPAGFRALCGGEALTRDLADALLVRTHELWNLYGPTETTIWSTAEKVQPGSGPISIGRPIANTQVYVLDDAGEPVPIGVAGEVWIGGAGVAKGYHRRPELTAERFTADRLAGQPGARLYRTGDLGRWRADGRLEHLGRLDSQVKIRGFRIELGEIESLLASHPAVGNAVVVAREASHADLRLIAYVVYQPGAELTLSEMRRHLKRELPDYMIPSIVVALDAVPLTPNGKVDRKALPDPFNGAMKTATDYEPPADGTQQALADIWCATLGLAKVGRRDDFFELGGHSLLATQVISRLRDVVGVELPVRVVFEASTLEALAQRVDAERASNGNATSAPPITVVDADGPMRLSFAQERMWLIQNLAPDNLAYNLPAAIRLRGDLDVAALSSALNELRRRHETLRTTYRMVDGEPMQDVHDWANEPLAAIDLRASGAAAEAQALGLAQMEGRTPFDLSRGPVFRSVLYRIAEQDHLLSVTLHHIACDRWSFGLLGRELAALYNERRAGREVALPALPIRYRDFAAWQRQWLQGEELERQLGYWTERLADVSPLELATDRPRPLVQTFNGRWIEAPLPAELVERIREAGRREGGTLFMITYAAFAALLHRLTGQQDIAIGVPIANRNRSAIEGLVGTFVNTLVMRADLSGAPSFRELLHRVRAAALDAYAHQDVPFEQLVERVGRRDTSRAPLVQVLFNVQNAPMHGVLFDGLQWEAVAVDRGAAQFELSFMIDTDISRSLIVEYNSDLFDAETVERLVEQYFTLLESAVGHAETKLAELPLLPLSQESRLRAWNESTSAAYPSQTVYATLFEAQVETSPDAVAVSFEGVTLSYRELNARANQLAWHLRSLGVGAGSLVGVCIDRGVDLCVALIGIHKSGGAYVPLDPGFPAERLSFMLEDSGAAVLVTAADAASAVDLPPGLHVVDMDAQASLVAAQSSANPEGGAGPRDAAYVIYTSGSTGRPKGVAVAHGALVNFLVSMRESPGLSDKDVLAAVTTISFDIAGLELYLPWLVGARVELVSREIAADGVELARLLKASQATVLQATPATWRLLLEADWRPPSGFCALCGGEALPRDLADVLLERVDALWNLYGPTETTIWSTVEQVQRGAQAITVGRPIANTQIYVVDAQGQQVPIGIPGEIWIGGAGVALGYHRRPELTAERFVRDTFSGAPEARLYRTGDLGRRLADGRVEHLGRLDHQVKIRGYRIELGEVEAVLGTHEAIRQCVVVARETAAGDRRLVAYVVYQPDEDLTVSEVRRHLKRELPDYMVPSVVVALDAIPLTPNGKVDRAAMPDPFKDAVTPAAEFEPPAPGMEQLLAGVWCDILQIERVGAEDNFFELGGHSLLSLRVAVAVEKQTGWKMDPRNLFFQNLRQVAAVARDNVACPA